MDDAARAEREVHSAGGGGLERSPMPHPQLRAFGSMRFDGVVPVAAEQLRSALAARGVHLEIVNMLGGEDIDQAVIEGIESCSTFIVFGSANYGQNTGNSACTYYESKYAQDRKKNIILIRMIPFDEDFEQPQARFMFGLNKLELPWLLGTPMPTDLPDKIVQAMSLSPALIVPEDVPQSSAAPVPAAGSAAAWPAELKDLVSIPSFVSCLAEMGVHSFADFGENVDLEENHATKMLEILDALPVKPKRNRAAKVRAQRCLADLLTKFRIYDKLDVDGDCELSREESASALASQVTTRSGGSLVDQFDAITGGTRLLNFTDFFAHVVIVSAEGVPPEVDADPEHLPLASKPSRKPQEVKPEPRAAEKQRGLWNRLCKATYTGRLEEIRDLLDQGAPVAYADGRGDEALHHAAMAGRNDVVDLLVSHRADVNTRNDFDRTPLILAAWKGHASTCSHLLSLGADPTLQNKAGQTALDGAERYGQAACVDVLKAPVFTIFSITGSNRLKGTPIVEQALQELRTQAEAQGMSNWWPTVTSGRLEAHLEILHSRGQFGPKEYVGGKVGLRVWNLTHAPIHCQATSPDGEPFQGSTFDVPGTTEGSQPRCAGAMTFPGHKWKIRVRRGSEDDLQIGEHCVVGDHAQHVFICGYNTRF